MVRLANNLFKEAKSTQDPHPKTTDPKEDRPAIRKPKWGWGSTEKGTQDRRRGRERDGGTTEREGDEWGSGTQPNTQTQQGAYAAPLLCLFYAFA